MSSSVSLVLPVLNEERGLASSTLRLYDYLTASLADYDWRIVIADNGSTDSTPVWGRGSRTNTTASTT